MRNCTLQINKHGMCYRHRNVLERLLLAAQLAVAAAGVAQDILPVDASDFLTLMWDNPGLLEDFPIAIALSAMKEPTATAAVVSRWKDSPPNYDVDELYSILDAAIRAVAARASTPGAEEEIPHLRELEQLNRQGAARIANFDNSKAKHFRSGQTQTSKSELAYSKRGPVQHAT